jgi:hypothetical protein
MDAVFSTICTRIESHLQNNRLDDPVVLLLELLFLPSYNRQNIPANQILLATFGICVHQASRCGMARRVGRAEKLAIEQEIFREEGETM